MLRLLLAFAATALVLSACSSNDKPSTDARTLHFWHFYSEPGQKAALKALVADFERTHSCTVELTELSWNDGKQKLQAAFNSGTPPDVVELGSDWIAQFSSAGVLMQLPSDSAGIAAFVPYSVAPGMWNSRVYAYPWTLDTRVLYANTDILSQCGVKLPITTMDELLAACRKVQDKGRQGFAANGADAHRLYKKILPFIWTLGGDVVDAQGNATLQAPAVQRAIAMYADLARTGFVETQRQLDASFIQGKVAFWISGQWILKKLRNNPSVHYQTMLMPGVNGQPGISFAGGEYLAVPNGSSNKQLARDFVRWMTDGANAIRFCTKVDEAGFPADARFFDNKALTADADRAMFSQQLGHARMTPVHPQWLEIEAELERMVEEKLLESDK